MGGIWRAWQPAGFQPSSHAQLLAAPHTWAASFNWRNCGCCALWVHAVRVVRAIWRPAGRAHVVDGQCGVAGQCGAAVIGRRGGFGRAGKHSPGKIHFFFRGRLDVRVPLAHGFRSILALLDDLKGGVSCLGLCMPPHEGPPKNAPTRPHLLFWGRWALGRAPATI